jgi:LysR family hydrogen peroxide-inducible transcriptional activator
MTTLRQLEYLVALKRHGSFSRAAEACFVSQPSLSEQLGKLEASLGTLVERGSRRSTLTPLGEAVAERAAHILASVAELESLARTGHLVRLGMIPTVGPYVFPRLLAEGDGVLPIQEQTRTLVELLDSHRIDAAVLAEGTFPDRFNAVPLGDDRLLLAVPATDAYSHVTDGVALSSLRDDQVLLLADGHCLADRVTDVCHTLGSRLGPVQASSLELLVEMVALSLGVTLLPELARSLAERNPRVRLVEPDLPPVRTLHLVYRPAFTPPPALVTSLTSALTRP